MFVHGSLENELRKKISKLPLNILNFVLEFKLADRGD